MTRVSLKYGAINLSQGFPDFNPPEAILSRLAEVTREDYHQYSITCGARNFREALAEKQSRLMGQTISPEDEIVVTCGSTEAMMVAMITVTNPGDSVIIFSPFYENYGADAILSGAVPIYVPLYPPDFRFRVDELEAAFRKSPKALILCNPSNPSGKVFTLEELETIADLAEKYDVYIITDEVYEHIVYEPNKHVYFASLPGMFERTLSCSSLSKTYSMTGWRLGYVIAPGQIIDTARKVHDFLTVGAAAPLQEAAVVGLRFGEDYYSDLLRTYTEKRDLFMKGLENIGISYTKPDGAYYIMLDISKFGYESDVQFCEDLAAMVGIGAVPGSSFFREEVNHLIRLHFAKKNETLCEALNRLEHIWTKIEPHAPRGIAHLSSADCSINAAPSILLNSGGRKTEDGFMTRAVHAGNDIDAETGAIRRPITMANSYTLPYDPSGLNWSSADGNIYTRNGGANQRYLQEKIASLEGAEDCVVLASGVAALSGVFFAFLNSGDHAVVSDSTYIAAYRLLHELLPGKYGVRSALVDSSDPENVRAALRPETKLIHIETPANPTLKVSDIQAIAEIAHEVGAILSVDNTFASPYNQKPLNLGADLCVESLTKYINGHGDAMGGAVAGPHSLIDRIRAEAMVNLGGAISPFNAWLIMRGAVTLPLRMEHHNKSALSVARFLESNTAVRFVSYPGLESHFGHGVAKKQMNNRFGGVMAFGLRADHDAHNRFVSHLRVITSAVSLGHDESLIVFLGENDERQHLYPKEFHEGFFRLSIGLEDTNDIINDIKRALEKSELR
jgi:cystathionine beta-lyase/cystathionine gamma-synthase